MPLQTIQGHPYCVPNNYQTGDGANMALWNEFAESVKFELNNGINCIVNYGNRGVSPTYYPTAVGSSGATINFYSNGVNPIVLQSAEFGFELMPGWDQFRFVAPVWLPEMAVYFDANGFGVFNTFIGLRKYMNLKITIYNISRGTSQVIGHFFTDENIYNSYCAGAGYSPHGTPTQYVTSIGTAERFLNYSVDIPSSVAPISDNSDIARLKIELLGVPINQYILLRVGQTYPNFAGVNSFILKQIMQCQ